MKFEYISLEICWPSSLKVRNGLERADSGVFESISHRDKLIGML